MSINFTARFIDNTTISQKVSMFRRTDVPATIIEFDNKNPDDMLALNKTATAWDNIGGRYALNIYNRATSRYGYSDIIKSHYYGLTTQRNNFEKIEPDKVLGLMMFSETKNIDNEIEYLEVNPATNKTKNYIRKFKKVGSRLVEFVQRAYKEKGIFLEADWTAIKFYKKLGFEQPYKDYMKECQLFFKR